MLWLEQNLRNEALKFFVRENLPVYFTTAKGSSLYNPGSLDTLPPLEPWVEEIAARHYAMRISYGPTHAADIQPSDTIDEGWSSSFYGRKEPEQTHMIFLAADLPLFVAGFLHSEEYRLCHKELDLSIDHPSVAFSTGDTDISLPPTRLLKLLEPLRKLHSFGKVSIDYPGSDSYKDEIIANIMSVRPASSETIGKAVTLLRGGNDSYQAFLNSFPYCFGYLDTAIDRCQEALIEIKSSRFIDATSLEHGLYAGFLPERYVFSCFLVICTSTHYQQQQ